MPLPVARPVVNIHQPLMGTVVEIAIQTTDPQAAERADRAAVAEIHRLTAVFSTFDETSELCRWRRGEHRRPSLELVEVLQAAALWHTLSAGAFHPACAALRRHWRDAEQVQCLPTSVKLTELANALRELPFRVQGTGKEVSVEQVGDCADVDLNALAKGYIVDAAVTAARQAAGGTADWVVVNAGGDLRHSGAGEVTVGVEDPHEPYDNAPPLCHLRLADAALATSGSAHRGFRIGDHQFGHVIDPRTGRPVAHTASASVIAPSALLADAAATVAMVLAPAEALAFADAHGLAALVIDADGAAHRSARWPA